MLTYSKSQMNSNMTGIDMEALMMDEYANEKISQEMDGRLASISANRINQEINKHVLWKRHPLEIHLVGSSREGFPVSAWGDEDKMLYNTQFPKVLWTTKRGGNYVMAEQNVNKPVYVRLRISEKRYLDEDFRNIINNDGYVKTNDFIKANSIKGIYPNLDTQVRKGPSMVKTLNAEFVDIRTETSDTVYCLKCHSWPPFTSSFFARYKLNNWPPQKLLNKVKSLDCHVVPVGCPGGRLSTDIEWRLSFSVAERELITEMYEPYANCMFALKLIKKKYIIYSDSDKPTPFCSYFIKTACLWMCETFPHTDYSVMDLIRKVLDWLIDCYQHKHLPHYFIPQHNLISHLSWECCDNVRETLTAVKKDLSRKVLLSIDSEEIYEWLSKFHTDNRANIEQKLGQHYRTFVERVNTMRLKNHPGITKEIRDMLCAERSRNSLNHNLRMEQWAGYDFYLYLETLNCNRQEDIRLALEISEKCILSIIEQVKELVPKGYGEMFKTRLYRFLGDTFTHLLVPFRNRGYDELLNLHQNSPFYYYSLGQKIVFPDNYSDYGIGGQILVVQYHYLMGNYEELKNMCESILSIVELAKQCSDIRLASIELCLEKPLGVNAWATDELLYYIVKCTKILSVYLHPIALVLYIKARVLLTEGNTGNVLHVVKNMKECLNEAYNPFYIKTIKMFITIIESLVGLLLVMRRIIQNKNIIFKGK